MKTKIFEFKKLLRNHFAKQLESVNRARRGEEDDYKGEAEGAGTQYEDVDRLRRSEDGYDETEFEESKEDQLEETNLYSDADKKGAKKDDKEALGHAAPSDHKIPFSGMAESFILPNLNDLLEAFVSDVGEDPKLSDLENQRAPELKEETPQEENIKSKL